jgi:hypothetical protein
MSELARNVNHQLINTISPHLLPQVEASRRLSQQTTLMNGNVSWPRFFFFFFPYSMLEINLNERLNDGQKMVGQPTNQLTN